MRLPRWLRRRPVARHSTADHVRPIGARPIGGLLAGRSALITGAGRNIGRALALELAQEGATIHFTETDPGRRAALAQTLHARFGQGTGDAADISDPAQSDALCDRLAAAGALPDMLVHNVACQVEQPFAATTTDDWQRSLQTNVIGPAHLTRRFVAQWRHSGTTGTVLFISSLHQQLPSGWPAYSASKGALAMLVKELAVELAPDAIRVNAIAPGWVSEERRPARAALLHGETIDPAYIGRAAVFLLCDYFSHYTTGTTLTVDAGMALYSGRVPFITEGTWGGDA